MIIKVPFIRDSVGRWRAGNMKEWNWLFFKSFRYDKSMEFVKHPKGFLFSHHSEYFFETGEIPAEWKSYKIVNYKNVVEPLYKHEDEKKFQESMSQFANKAKLLVLIPDPLRLTAELIDACNQFCNKIKENPHFKEILKKHS